MEEAWELAAVSENLRFDSEKEDGRYVPVNIARPLLEECGYRCSVPRCKGTSALQLEHIEDWAKLDFKKHNFDKMIILCATCHARVTSKEIHKDAIRGYKRNLAIINGRYSLFEMRLLGRFFSVRDELLFHEDDLPDDEDSVYAVLARTRGKSMHLATEGDKIHLEGLLRDGLISANRLNTTIRFTSDIALPESFDNVTHEQVNEWLSVSKNDARWIILPTKKGCDFMDNYFGGKDLI